jgi:hypothetical protein
MNRLKRERIADRHRRIGRFGLRRREYRKGSLILFLEPLDSWPTSDGNTKNIRHITALVVHAAAPEQRPATVTDSLTGFNFTYLLSEAIGPSVCMLHSLPFLHLGKRLKSYLYFQNPRNLLTNLASESVMLILRLLQKTMCL